MALSIGDANAVGTVLKWLGVRHTDKRTCKQFGWHGTDKCYCGQPDTPDLKESKHEHHSPEQEAHR